ncbi:MAG: tryptophan--tRNA ligase [Candidatus Saccharibacteria bacterium]|nr:tryptophan--tRNA ligase [Candidatus Saccharibacteria bacterium]
MPKEVVLTGLRTNGAYHLGNYIGGILPILKLIQDNQASSYQINLFAPDLHSFTTPTNLDKLNQQTLENLKLFVACGVPLDDNNVNLYRQSYISAHSELTWILSNFTSWGEMSRMTEFKDKINQFKSGDQITVGLFSYPILMAADILLYDATWIPVGEDQRQHLEFCRNLAQRFNQRFKKDIFKIPADFNKQQDWLKRFEAPRIRSLKHPDKKMSKSIADPKGTIMLSDTSEEIAQKITSAQTDNLASIDYDWQNQPGITNLLSILAYLNSKSLSDIKQNWRGQSDYSNLKQAVIQSVQATLNEIQNSLKSVSDTVVLNHLKNREVKLNKIANQKLQQVQKIIGLR